MHIFLIVAGVFCFLTSITYAWLWYDRHNYTRFAISGTYFCVALFCVVRLYERTHEFSHRGDDDFVFVAVPNIVVAPIWALLVICNVIMAISIYRGLHKGTGGKS